MDRMREHLEAGYPNEACGALVGTANDSAHEVVEFRAMRNTITDRPWDRYALDPLEQLRVQKDADARGLEIVGFAHSHPDHPAIPSRFDAEHAWTFYSYVVASVRKGSLAETRAWRLRDGDRTFDEEPLEIP
jgi:proteasome lid subunit RPN8/RPN11